MGGASEPSDPTESHQERSRIPRIPPCDATRWSRLTRFFIWLEEAFGGRRDAFGVRDRCQAIEFPSYGYDYVSDSFGTIAGYNGHGAGAVHYSATPESSYRLEKKVYYY